MNTYYVPFYPAESIDYLTLLAFYDIAEYNSTTQVFDTIHYQSIRSLAEVLGLSTYAVNTALNGGKYEKYLSIDKAQKTITIKNCFTRSQKSLTPFVVLKHSEVELLRK